MGDIDTCIYGIEALYLCAHYWKKKKKKKENFIEFYNEIKLQFN